MSVIAMLLSGPQSGICEGGPRMGGMERHIRRLGSARVAPGGDGAAVRAPSATVHGSGRRRGCEGSGS